MATSSSLWNRMFRALQLSPAVYEEVESDAGATGQALLAVVLVSLAGGIGAAIEALVDGDGASLVWGLFFGLGTAIIGWLVWALFVYMIGVSILKGPNTSSSWGEVLRTMGFANAPGLLRIFAFIPVAGSIIAAAGSIWTLVAAVVAVRQALDFSTARAIATAAVGWLAYMFLIFGLAALLGSAPVVL